MKFKYIIIFLLIMGVQACATQNKSSVKTGGLEVTLPTHESSDVTVLEQAQTDVHQGNISATTSLVAGSSADKDNASVLDDTQKSTSSIIPAVNTQAAQKQLSNLLDNFKSLSAGFEQIVYNEQGQALQKTWGKIDVDRPGKFYWETLKPLHQIIITKDNKAWIYDPELEQVLIQKIQSVGVTPATLLSGDNTTLIDAYNIESIGTKDKPAFRLTPKQASDFVKNFVLGFTDGHISQMTISDNLGQHTVIRFTNVVINTDIDAKQFDLNIPKDVDIVDQSKNV